MQLAPPKSSASSAHRDAVGLDRAQALITKRIDQARVKTEAPLCDDRGHYIDFSHPVILDISPLIPLSFYPIDEAQQKMRRTICANDGGGHVLVKLNDVFNAGRRQETSTCKISDQQTLLRIINAAAEHNALDKLYLTRGDGYVRTMIKGSYVDPIQQPRGFGLTAWRARDIILGDEHHGVPRFILPPIVVRQTSANNPLMRSRSDCSERTLYGRTFMAIHHGEKQMISLNYSFDGYKIDDARALQEQARLSGEDAWYLAIPTIGRASNQDRGDGITITNLHLIPGIRFYDADMVPALLHAFNPGTGHRQSHGRRKRGQSNTPLAFES